MGDNNGSDTRGWQVVRFTIDDLSMGIDILGVREVTVIARITPVQQAPSFVRGLINLRGQTVTVVDLGVKLGRPGRTVGEQAHVIVLKQAHVGILIDTIGEIVPVAGGIEPVPSTMGFVENDAIEGVVNLEHDPVLIVSPEGFLDSMVTNSRGEKA
ncbi:MAG: purine-binding chemotaxis protein CheW [Desulfobacterium sp.]|nr:purine-binding chemotaxis protein CheW [Desulfobacterium sp.]